MHWGAAMKVEGQVAFVTGGSGDIGRAIAEALAAAGADVAVSYVGEKARADEVVETLPEGRSAQPRCTA
jgi:3-oxoacyl-[acyl-carrier protein] reductase